ncbi:heavy-metal-associated domain-containing protein [Atopobium deltae]|uniref:Putative copper chaperone CopZ n=1 Tax=Atopobium deltae TaxID=1393034 RepID=A0A133XW26_9ACTN|nr:cation transporter [Atopobium deltae]KXB35147.1 putative copper chaperone CopZ [Atopobium deltae]
MKHKTICIEGMTCQHCQQHVQQALEAVPGVKNVKVSLESGTAQVDAGLLVSNGKLERAVQEAGYTAVEIR